MSRTRLIGIVLTAIVATFLLAFALTGFQRSAATFFIVGGVGLCVGLVSSAFCFRKLFDSPEGLKWLNATMIILSLHAILLAGEGALRAIERWKWEFLSERERFLVDEYLPTWRNPEIASLHEPNPGACLKLVPNRTVKFLNSTIRINSQGTRGPEFPLEKPPSELRVLCLGASTTWGVTVNPSDRPYPEVLEERLEAKLNRPVTVINAGIVGLPVQCTAKRLEKELLRFNPDCAVFYEAFANIPSGIRREFRFQTRGSLLLQQAMLLHASLPTYTTSYPLGKQEIYRVGVERIAELCQEHGIQLFLCTFALAYDEHTPQQYLDFYQRIMPLYGGQTALSALNCVRKNNEIVVDIATTRDLPVVEVASSLGGKYEHFIDFCHFYQSGRELLAQQIADSIIPWAEAAANDDASETPPHNLTGDSSP